MIKLPKEDTVFRKKGNKVLEWGEKEYSIMKPYIKKSRVCLDIGAHVGITTLRFAKFFDEVHSFEPVHYKFLIENTKHLSNVKSYNFAISDKNESVEMYPGTANSGAGIIPDEYNERFIKSRYLDPCARYKDVKKILVECKTIDSLDFKNVDLIKIDVEGYILPVLTGMISTLTNSKPVIQLEMSAFNNVNTKAHNILLNLGYMKFNTYDQDWFYRK